MAKTEMNREMDRLIEAFMRCAKEHDHCVSAQRCARSNLDDAALLLARTMLPDDARAGEVYCCWVRIGEDEVRLRVKWERSALGVVFYSAQLGSEPTCIAEVPPGSADSDRRSP